MSLMVDSGLNSLHDKLNDEDKNGGIEGPSQFTAYFVEITSSNSVAFTLAWCYLLHVIKQKDRYHLLSVLVRMNYFIFFENLWRNCKKVLIVNSNVHTNLNEDMIIAVAIAVEAIANEPENNIGALTERI